MDPKQGEETWASSLVVVVLLALLLPPILGVLARNGTGGLEPFIAGAVLVPPLLLGYLRGPRGAAAGALCGVLSGIASFALAGGTLFTDPLGWILSLGLLVLVLGMLGQRFRADLRRAETMALTDNLTRLPNQRHAHIFLERQFAAAERGSGLVIVLFDLDHFKQFNDELGHAAGDLALRSFAEVVSENTRKMNLSARVGGEEFLSILSDSSIPGALTFSERVRRSLKTVQFSGKPLSVSVGVAAYHPAMKTAEDLLAAADNALYQAKRDGRDCIRVFGGSSGMDSPDRAHTQIRSIEELNRPAPRDVLNALVIQPAGDRRDDLIEVLEEEGFVAHTSETRSEGLALASERPDLAVIDLQLVDQGGPAACVALKARWPGLPILALMETIDERTIQSAVTASATRYLEQPLSTIGLRATIRDLMDTPIPPRQTLPAEEWDDRKDLLIDLADRVEVQEEFSAGHGLRVQRMSEIVGEYMAQEGFEVDQAALSLGARIHDVGRVSVGSTLLNKVLPLTPDEHRRIHLHPIVGSQVTEALLAPCRAQEVVRWHTEHWDGRGYPDGLAGSSIPIEARIVRVVEALDAMTAYRRYRPPLTFAEALEELEQRSGTQFDPDVVRAVEALAEPLEAVLAELREVAAESDAIAARR